MGLDLEDSSRYWEARMLRSTLLVVFAIGGFGLGAYLLRATLIRQFLESTPGVLRIATAVILIVCAILLLLIAAVFVAGPLWIVAGLLLFGSLVCWVVGGNLALHIIGFKHLEKRT